MTGFLQQPARFNYGPKAFDLTFENDFDRAAYITAQKTLSEARKGSTEIDFVAAVVR